MSGLVALFRTSQSGLFFPASVAQCRILPNTHCTYRGHAIPPAVRPFNFRLCISLLHAFFPPLECCCTYCFLPHLWPNRPQSNNRNPIPTYRQLILQFHPSLLSLSVSPTSSCPSGRCLTDTLTHTSTTPQDTHALHLAPAHPLIPGNWVAAPNLP